jgi:DNA polymerase I-like protein with 3'-5' exonuclease and polymerase domains
VKSLELVTAAYLSRDPTLTEEIKNGVDIHASNQTRFNLPERVTAKTFVFRLIYGGQAYSYAHDPAFNHISKSQKYWQRVIDDFYNKYPTIAQWHQGLVKTVLETGQYVAPTGRAYTFPRADVAHREWFWRPKILNYPVQGLGADLVAIGRVTMWKRLRAAGLPVLFQSTVHDSIDIDVDRPEEVCYNSRVGEKSRLETVVSIVKQSIIDIPTNFYRLFGVPFDLPLNSEVSVGPTLKEQEKR